jgi:hypothetical protein
LKVEPPLSRGVEGQVCFPFHNFDFITAKRFVQRRASQRLAPNATGFGGWLECPLFLFVNNLFVGDFLGIKNLFAIFFDCHLHRLSVVSSLLDGAGLDIIAKKTCPSFADVMFVFRSILNKYAGAGNGFHVLSPHHRYAQGF